MAADEDSGSAANARPKSRARDESLGKWSEQDQKDFEKAVFWWYQARKRREKLGPLFLQLLQQKHGAVPARVLAWGVAAQAAERKAAAVRLNEVDAEPPAEQPADAQLLSLARSNTMSAGQLLREWWCRTCPLRATQRQRPVWRGRRRSRRWTSAEMGNNQQAAHQRRPLLLCNASCSLRIRPAKQKRQPMAKARAKAKATPKGRKRLGKATPVRASVQLQLQQARQAAAAAPATPSRHSSSNSSGSASSSSSAAQRPHDGDAAMQPIELDG